jgi:uncharacterized protein YigA (DUF484 family)
MWSWIKNAIIWFLEFLGFRVKKSQAEKIVEKQIEEDRKEVAKIDRKLKKLKKKGVEKKSLQEEVDYWKENK